MIKLTRNVPSAFTLVMRHVSYGLPMRASSVTSRKRIAHASLVAVGELKVVFLRKLSRTGSRLR